jgi:pimeloyl-ACP methyl ester carboxylesterase
MLEVIDKGSSTESHPIPLLFIHGAWHAAWCWDEHFLDFFADKGFHAVAVSLRNQGNSHTMKPRTCLARHSPGNLLRRSRTSGRYGKLALMAGAVDVH